MSRVRSAVLRLLGDAKIASRRLRRAPLFAATAVLVLGLGIGIGTTFFNVINAGLFKGRASLPGAVRVVGSNWPPGLSGLLGPGDVAAVAEHPPASLAWVIGLGSARQTTARILDTSLRLRADGISGPYFKVFGATPIAGRLLDGGDEQSDLAPGAVISERLWRTRFSADSAVVGSTAYVAGQPIVIVGVVARPFTGLASIPATDLWVPSRVIPVDQLYGRLRDGVTVRQADQEVRSQYAVPVPGVTDRRLALESGFEADLPSSETAVLATILALGGLVLVIAAASLTLLLLARILGSQSDIGIRLMLGARLSDVAQLWATEVSIIAVAATVVGLTMGGWFARIVLDQFSAVAGMDTSNVDVSPDWRVVLYATGLTLVVAVGIIGALTKRISIVGTIAATTAAAGNGAITPRNGDTRGGLMAAQIAIATCLLLVSVYFWRSTMATAHIDPGFDPSHVVVARLDQAGRDGVRTEANNLRALAAAARAPGIDHAALATRLTARLGNGARTSEAAQTYSVQPVGVTAKFFDVLQVAVVRGRSFSAAEEEAAAPVVIVSAHTAAALWPNMDPVGLRLWLEQAGGTYSPVQVIGVVRDLFPDMRERPPRDVYLPYRYEATRFPHYSAILLARGPGLPQELGRRLLAQVTSEEPQVGLSAIRSMDDEVRGDAGSADLLSRLLAALGLIGLVLAITGLYGLTAFLATQRRREFGIRKALGATNLWLSTMVAVEGFPPLLKGAGLGAGMAVFIGYWLRARSFPTLAPFDWLALLVVSALLPLVGMVGTVLPFRRMLRAEASQMLRED